MAKSLNTYCCLSGPSSNNLGSQNVSQELVYGDMSLCGRARDMVDAFTAITNFCQCEGKPLHFFGMYDGHTMPEVAQLCKEWMHEFVKEEIKADEEKITIMEMLVTVMKRSFDKMNDLALDKIGKYFAKHLIETRSISPSVLSVLVAPEHIVLGNYGFCRVMLGRAGKAIPLSFVYKPEPEEYAKIESLGARVFSSQGWIVKTSADHEGDQSPKQAIISDPNITIIKRAPEDELMVLGSDGFWDVVAPDVAYKFASGCLNKWNKDSNLDASPTTLTASALTSLAMSRKSSDNITVIVVDLMNN